MRRLKMTIHEELIKRNWKIDSVTKDYRKTVETFVGSKDIIIFSNLKAVYYSEGRNILESLVFYNIEDFLNEIETRIDQSYARKLLIKERKNA